MSHVRSQIVAAVLARIAAIPEFSAPQKVERGRYSAVSQDLLPAITLTWGEAGESADRRAFASDAGQDGYDRSVPLAVVVHLRDEDAEEEFDRICVLVERVMEDDVTLGGLCVDLRLQTTRLYVDTRTGLPLGAGSLSYQLIYKTLASDPEALAI